MSFGKYGYFNFNKLNYMRSDLLNKKTLYQFAILSYLHMNTIEIVICVFKVSAVINWLKSLCIVVCCRLAWNSTEFIWMWLQYCTQNVLQIDFLYSLRELECECPKQVGKDDEQFNSCHLFPQTYTVPCRRKGKRVSCIKLSSEKELQTKFYRVL